MTVKRIDLIAVAFLIYSIYFGAGNLIFPIKVGYRVGIELVPTIFGFILAAVVLPAIVLWSCARVGGGLDKITAALPRWMALTLAISLYIIIGPFVGLPRFSGVAYQTMLPLIGGSRSALGVFLFSLAFFGVTLYFAIKPGKILNVVGRYMAPVLVIVLLFIAFGAVVAPQGNIAAPDPTLSLASSAGFVAYGFEEGYQTLNALGSLVLAVVILNSVRGLGLEGDAVTSVTMKGMVIAGAGLAVTFIALGHLGATSHALVGQAQNAVTGAEASPPYAMALYGRWGMVALAIVVTLACLTTAIGLISACGTYFSQTIPVASYATWTLIFSVASVLMANIGLGPLLALARPVLLGVYPIAMCIAILCLFQDRMPDKRFVFLVTLIPVVPLGIIEGFRTGGVERFSAVYENLSVLPMYSLGFGWIVPALAFFSAGMYLAGRKKAIVQTS